jgi:hypothetical protein
MSVALDIDLALKRVELDHRLDRAFVSPPFEMSLIDMQRADWIASIEATIAKGGYHPEPALIASIPKGGGTVRPGVIISLADQVMYAAIVGAALTYMEPVLKWCAPPKDYAYQFRNINDVECLVSQYRCWNSFRLRSLELLESTSGVVVTTDITGFYEHIDHGILISNLRSAGVPEDINNLISRCLGRWCAVNKRGLPQNNTASHILAKLYLTQVDHALEELGIQHIRYVDDTRIFCSNRGDARRALLELSVLLRERGLTLQGSKTKLRLPGDARKHFEGVVPVIAPLAKHYREDIARQVGRAPQYMTVTEAEELVMRGVADIPAGMLRAAYDAHFQQGEEPFEKSLFHFLILRLGRARDRFALDHCFRLLDEHPEETEWILNYVANVGAVAESESRLVDFLRSADAVYEYQRYQILRWRTRISIAPGSDMLAYVRSLVAAPKTASYLLASCRAFQGRFGSSADLDTILRHYGAADSDQERSELICSATRVEAGRRNAFLGKAKEDGFLTAAAVKGVREGRDWYSTKKSLPTR